MMIRNEKDVREVRFGDELKKRSSHFLNSLSNCPIIAPEIFLRDFNGTSAMPVQCSDQYRCEATQFQAGLLTGLHLMGRYCF